jgi:hypothetical protein
VKQPNVIHTGVTIGQAAQQLLDPSSTPEGTVLGPYGWTMTDAVHRIDHLAAHSKAELLAAIAYLACQYHGAREDKTDVDARHALAKIRHALDGYEERNP